MSEVLVTGGNGYIGSHLCKALTLQGREVVVLDNNPDQKHDYCKEYYTVDYGDKESVKALFCRHDIKTIFHQAALSNVQDSMKDPVKYYSNNVKHLISFVDLCIKAGVQNFVFASSAAVYGEAREGRGLAFLEQKCPQNPYGTTKLAGENLLKGLRDQSEMSIAILRYFNVAGVSSDGDLGLANDDHHLIPMIVRALINRRSFNIYGMQHTSRKVTKKGMNAYYEDSDAFYDDLGSADGYLEDGSAIRDYVHVDDVIQANLLAEQHMPRRRYIDFDVGTGTGTTVKQMFDTACNQLNTSTKVNELEARKGDPAELVAWAEHHVNRLCWKATQTQHNMIKSTYDWYIKQG